MISIVNSWGRSADMDGTGNTQVVNMRPLIKTLFIGAGRAEETHRGYSICVSILPLRQDVQLQNTK